MGIYFWILTSIPLIYMSIFALVPHYFDYYSLTVSFDIGQYEFYNSVFLFQDCFGSLGPLNLRMNFKITLLAGKNASWDFDRDCVESVNQFGEYCHCNSSLNFIPSLKREFDSYLQQFK